MTETPGCEAVAVTCIDYRMVEPLRERLEERELTARTDLVSWPGGALGLALGGESERTALLGVLDLAHRLHAPARVLLAAHQDCGWLGGSGRFGDHEEEAAYLDGALADAAELVAARFPGVAITCLRLA